MLRDLFNYNSTSEFSILLMIYQRCTTASGASSLTTNRAVLSLLGEYGLYQNKVRFRRPLSNLCHGTAYTDKTSRSPTSILESWSSTPFNEAWFASVEAGFKVTTFLKLFMCSFSLLSLPASSHLSHWWRRRMSTQCACMQIFDKTSSP